MVSHRDLRADIERVETKVDALAAKRCAEERKRIEELEQQLASCILRGVELTAERDELQRQIDEHECEPTTPPLPKIDGCAEGVTGGAGGVAFQIGSPGELQHFLCEMGDTPRVGYWHPDLTGPFPIPQNERSIVREGCDNWTLTPMPNDSYIANAGNLTQRAIEIRGGTNWIIDGLRGRLGPATALASSGYACTLGVYSAHLFAIVNCSLMGNTDKALIIAKDARDFSVLDSIFGWTFMRGEPPHAKIKDGTTPTHSRCITLETSAGSVGVSRGTFARNVMGGDNLRFPNIRGCQQIDVRHNVIALCGAYGSVLGSKEGTPETTANFVGNHYLRMSGYSGRPALFASRNVQAGELSVYLEGNEVAEGLELQTDFAERGFLADHPFPVSEVAAAGDWRATVHRAGPPISDAYDDAFRRLLFKGELTMIDGLEDVSLS
jgi:hypothetical protein